MTALTPEQWTELDRLSKSVDEAIEAWRAGEPWNGHPLLLLQNAMTRVRRELIAAARPRCATCRGMPRSARPMGADTCPDCTDRPGWSA